jgi:AmiR/NasT family two-component response regulator
MHGDVTAIRPGLRVLVVEDEFLIALEIEQMLVGLGCIVVGPAPTVLRALTLIDREELDFAILDVNLGCNRSTPVAERLWAAGVPFALATGYDDRQLPEEAFRNAPHLGKPLDHHLLISALGRL